MPLVIIADENDGRRNLLASSIERAGFEVTRASTLRQCEGTALATMADVVLIEGDWSTGDALSAAGRLTGDAEFELKSRVVILSGDNSQDYLISAGQAGVSEVISKPVDMGKLLEQITKHANKMFVPPPGGVEKGKSGTGMFEVNLVADEPSWALPILQDLLGEDAINEEFVNQLLTDMELGIDGLDVETTENLLRTAFDRLIHGAEEHVSEMEAKRDGLDADDEDGDSDGDGGAPAFGSSRMLKAMERRAKRIEEEIAASLENLMDMPDEIAILTEDTGLKTIDPDSLKFTRTTLETVHELLFDLAIPGRLVDVTRSTQVMDAAEMTKDALDSLPPEELDDEEDDEDADDPELKTAAD